MGNGAGMAGVIAAHEYDFIGLVCGCGVVCGSDEDTLTYAAHVAEALTRAGYGNIPDALREAAGEIVGMWEELPAIGWGIESEDVIAQQAVENTLRALAAVYADHEDYQDEWPLNSSQG